MFFSRKIVIHTVALSSRHGLKPNSITLAGSDGAGSEQAPNRFGASPELASVMEFGFYTATWEKES